MQITKKHSEYLHEARTSGIPQALLLEWPFLMLQKSSLIAKLCTTSETECRIVVVGCLSPTEAFGQVDVYLQLCGDGSCHRCPYFISSL